MRRGGAPAGITHGRLPTAYEQPLQQIGRGLAPEIGYERNQSMSSKSQKRQSLLPEQALVEKSISLITTFDLVMVVIQSALIAGVAVWLLVDEPSLWVGTSLFLSLFCFVSGMGHTLAHLSATGKMLFSLGALISETDDMPNVFDDEGPPEDMYARSQARAGRSFGSQLLYLAIGVGLVSFGLVVRLWEYAWRAGVIIMCVFAAIFVAGVLTVVWKAVFGQSPPSTTADRQP